MPEVSFVVRWPDGSAMACYSPSLIVTEYFEAGRWYALSEFVRRAREAFGIASERVRAKYGIPCARAQSQLASIEMRARAFASEAIPHADELGVTVESFVPL